MYTPSAYTLTNTTRPHELNAKNPRRRFFRRMGRGKIGILAKERTVHNCTNDRITDRSTHSKRSEETKRKRDPRHATRRSRRFQRIRRRIESGRRTPRDLGKSRYTMKSKLPWFSSVQPHALTHISIHGSYDESLSNQHPRVEPTPLRVSACTHTHNAQAHIHVATRRYYTFLYTS